MSARNSTRVFHEEAGISRPELAKAVRVDQARRVWTYTKVCLGELHILKIYIEFAHSFQRVRHFVTNRNKAGNPSLDRETSMAELIRSLAAFSANVAVTLSEFSGLNKTCRSRLNQIRVSYGARRARRR
jgi:hypothetical protein